MSIRLGVVGLGGHALQSHIIPGIALGFTVTGLFDPVVSDKNLAALTQAISTVPTVYASLDDMLGAQNIDAVLITSPDEFHPEQLYKVVTAGKPVLCEKPLAVDRTGLATVAAAFRLATKNNVPIMSCHPRREPPQLPYGWVKNNLHLLQERFGATVHVELDFSYHKPVASWKENRSLLLDHFVHEIDFLLWLFGDVPFSAHTLTDSFERYCVAGEMAGMTFLFNGTRYLESKVYPETIRLRFNRGTCEVNTQTGWIDLRNHENERIQQVSVLPTNYDIRSRTIMADFAAIIGGKFDLLQHGHLLAITTAAVALAAPRGLYRHRPGI